MHCIFLLTWRSNTKSHYFTHWKYTRIHYDTALIKLTKCQLQCHPGSIDPEWTLNSVWMLWLGDCAPFTVAEVQWY
jgi:hypothetical protein